MRKEARQLILIGLLQRMEGWSRLANRLVESCLANRVAGFRLANRLAGSHKMPGWPWNTTAMNFTQRREKPSWIPKGGYR